MDKEELKDEIKNRISMALKDPILQQGFEIICKENAELKELKKKKEEIEIMTNFCKTCKKMHTDQLVQAKEILQKLIANAPDTYSGTNIELQQRKMFSFQDAVNKAEQFLKEIEK